METLLTAQNLAERYSCSDSKIYRLNCYTPEKLPPSIRIGTAVRWKLTDVEEWEAAQNKKENA